MISNVLLAHASLVPVLFWVAVVVSAVVGWLLYRSGRRGALVGLTTLGLIATLALTVSPTGIRSPVFCTVQFSVPFQGIDTLANLAMLLPSTIFAALALRRPVAVLIVVSGLSALIELVQALVPLLGRACDTNDWFMNTVGAVLGAALAAAIMAVSRRPQRRPVGHR